MTRPMPHPNASIASAVTAVLRLVMEGASLRSCLDSLCLHLEDVCEIDSAAAFVLYEDRLRLGGYGHLPQPLAEMSDAQADAADTVVARAAHMARVVLVEDLDAADAQDRHVHALAVEAGLRGMLTIPVTGADHRALGVLALGTFAPRAWDEGTLELATAFADLAGLVLEREQARRRAAHARDRAAYLSHRLGAVLDAVPTVRTGP